MQVVLQTKALVLTFQSAVIALPNTPPTVGRDELQVWAVYAGNVQLERELITDWLADVCEPMEYIVCQLVGGLLIPEMH